MFQAKTVRFFCLLTPGKNWKRWLVSKNDDGDSGAGRYGDADDDDDDIYSKLT